MFCPGLVRAVGDRMIPVSSVRRDSEGGLPTELPIDGHSLVADRHAATARQWSTAEKSAIVAAALRPVCGREQDCAAPKAASQPAVATGATGLRG